MLEEKKLGIKDKILIVGLPKSGTSTLTVMLRILGYSVTGPSPVNNNKFLDKEFEKFNAFQDYPWCFEYKYLLEKHNMKIIVLKREPLKWANSFKKNFGGNGINYNCYNYLEISKNEPDYKFVEYHEDYYYDAIKFLNTKGFSYLKIDLENLNWKDICQFLQKPIPKNAFGFTTKIPKTNSNNHKKKRFYFKFIKLLKKIALSALGKNYLKFSALYHKNKL